MQIILQEDVEKLGHRGDVVTVKPGYARNFLLPKKLGVEATPGNMKALERIRGALAKKTATELDAARQAGGAVERGFGEVHAEDRRERPDVRSVTSGDIADGLKAQGFTVDKRQVQLGEPLKSLGEFPVTVKVFRDVTAEIKVHVDKEM